MFLFYGDKLGHWLVKNLATWTMRECGINGRTWNNYWNVGGTLRRGLLRHTRLGIRFEVRCMIQRFIGVLKLGLVSVPLATLVQTSLELYRSPTGPGR